MLFSTKDIFPRLTCVTQYLPTSEQRAGMGCKREGAVGFSIRADDRAKLLQVGLCYTGRLTGAQRLYRGVELGTVQVYRQPRKLSSDLMPVQAVDISVSGLWLSRGVHVTRHAPSDLDLVTIHRIVLRIGKVYNLILFGFTVRRKYFSICW